MRALNSAGIPTAFNFGTTGVALILRDVAVSGERVGEATTTLVGGRTSFFVDAPGVAVSIRSIHFDRNRGAPIVVSAASRAEVLDNVITGVIGIPVGFRLSQASGIQVEGDIFAPGHITDSVVIAGNSIDGVDAQHANGIVVIGVSATVEVVGNEVRRSQTNGILTTFNSGATSIEDNLVVPGVMRFPDPDEPANEFGNGIVAGLGFESGARYLISRNSLLLEDRDADGILLFGLVSNEGSLIDHNDVTMVGSDFGGITLVGFINRSLVAHNKVSGAAATGVGVQALFPDSLAEGNVFQANNLTKLDTTLADVFLDASTNGTLVVGNAGTVIDLGTNNSVTGFRRAVAAPSRGQRLSDVLRQSHSLRELFED